MKTNYTDFSKDGGEKSIFNTNMRLFILKILADLNTTICADWNQISKSKNLGDTKSVSELSEKKIKIISDKRAKIEIFAFDWDLERC